MKLTQYSKSRLALSASRWSVPREFYDPLFNYLIYGFQPGSFWEAALANDFIGAISSSHPGNDISFLKKVVGWINESFPEESFGSYLKVKAWCQLDPIVRRAALERMGLIYSEYDEVNLALKGEPAPREPILW